MRNVPARLGLAWLLGLTAAEAVGSEIIENPTYTGPKTTVTYAMWGGAGEVKYAREICRKFVEAHPDIRVDVSVYPWGQYWAKIQTQTAGGIAPDVMSFYSGAVGVWA
ncbi:MAG: extracellular solute-binding protein, partial [Armatimonadetes bacterium]|nr:extracellular solute-binding protein [Armatimonadota bacterium]